MPYTITHSDNDRTITVLDKTLNADTSLKFVGVNYNGYAKDISENFLHLLESFASNLPPENPIEGQLWYDTDIDSTIQVPQLKVFDGTMFVPATNVFKGVSKPTGARIGDIWIDIAKQQLFIYSGLSGSQYAQSGTDGHTSDEANWLLIGPQFSAGSQTGPIADKVYDISNKPHNIIKFSVGIIEDESVNPPVVRTEIAAILSFTQFVPKAAIPGFTEIKPGFNLSTTSDVKIWGTATQADSLLVGSTVVLASNFLRSDVSSTSLFKFNVANDEGVAVGPSLTSGIKTTGTGSTVLYNNVENSEIILRLANGTITADVITASKNLVDVKSSLSVAGATTAQGSLTVNDTTNSVSTTTGSIVTAGGLATAKSAFIGSTATIRGTLTVGPAAYTNSTEFAAIVPATNNKFSIGTASNKFKSIFTDEITATTISCTEFTGTFTGNVLGAAASLLNPTSYKIAGEFESDVVQSNHAAGSTVILQPVATQELFNNRGEPVVDSSLFDQLLINKPQVGLRRITKEKFIANLPLIPVGTILMYAGSVLPAGYLECDGREVKVSDYQKLFDIIGRTYTTGDSFSTFNLPTISSGNATKYMIYTGVI